ncbi:hypothetical protein O53_5103 [Microcystis aeruginosa TAIHU98]|uniref:Uncharacterized protein n=1 Tax=Microcystis aeruginosa TAIHU98 TaxID=1134457 RepID=L7E0L7_MICAE|nr:hypothetical protein O53_5103 [Microcystis aeruginosa TAIHU98]
MLPRSSRVKTALDLTDKNPRLLQAGKCQLINTWDSINRFSQSKRH